MVIFFYLPNCW